MSIEPGLLGDTPPLGREPEGERVRRVEDRLARRGGWVELLRGPAALYGLAVGLRNALYDRGLLRAHRVGLPLVSVGNLTAGGTGKTPMVVHLARRLLERGRRPAILARGYGAPTASGRSDEAEVLVRALPEVPYLARADRVAGAAELLSRGADVILADDAFQHRRLARDLDLVLIDATRPWGLPAVDGEAVRALLPRGLLREPLSSLARADALVLTRADQAQPALLEELRRELARQAPGLPLLEARHRCVAVRDADGFRITPDVLAGREVDLASGIGHPEAFERTVRAAGARVRVHRRCRDHHDWSARDLRGLGGSRPLVTTSKDAVKIEALGVAPWVVEVEMEVTAGAPVLEALLDALPQARAERERAAIHEGLHG